KDEVASVDNDMARSMASERLGFGNQSLLEQWRDSYGNGDYDDDPYDDDIYEGQDLQALCDNLDIRVRAMKPVREAPKWKKEWYSNIVGREDGSERGITIANMES
nr:hypothetical protein [Tanacetum cinerariifolium]